MGKKLMDDLVKELRNPKGTSGSDFNATYWCGLANKAADRIEALEAALEKIADTDPDDGTQWFHDVANAALEEKKDGQEV
jgi:hypothetical protein